MGLDIGEIIRIFVLSLLYLLTAISSTLLFPYIVGLICKDKKIGTLGTVIVSLAYIFYLVHKIIRGINIFEALVYMWSKEINVGIKISCLSLFLGVIIVVKKKIMRY